MPICRIIWMAGRSDETKNRLRNVLAQALSKAVHTKPEHINIYFEDHLPVDMPKDGTLVRIYISAGRSEEDKDHICEAVARSIHDVAGVHIQCVDTVITDIPPGNLGVGTVIINREGIPTQRMAEGKMADISALYKEEQDE